MNRQFREKGDFLSNQLNLDMIFTQICFMSSEDLQLHTTKRMDDGRAEARE